LNRCGGGTFRFPGRPPLGPLIDLPRFLPFDPLPVSPGMNRSPHTTFLPQYTTWYSPFSRFYASPHLPYPPPMGAEVFVWYAPLFCAPSPFFFNGGFGMATSGNCPPFPTMFFTSFPLDRILFQLLWQSFFSLVFPPLPCTDQMWLRGRHRPRNSVPPTPQFLSFSPFIRVVSSFSSTLSPFSVIGKAPQTLILRDTNGDYFSFVVAG